MEIPKEVRDIIKKLRKSGYGAYIVGGCVRDLLLAHRSLGERGLAHRLVLRSSESEGGSLGEGGGGTEPKDWDIATSARPEEIKKVFPKSFYENKFFTVTAQTGSKDPRLKEIEITTYRSEAKYTDKRHPDEVKFAKTLEEDLKRRDFTINALAIDLPSSAKASEGRQNSQDKLEILDFFGGQKDIENKIIRAVGNPKERFEEDALRMMRAVRLASVLGFEIEFATAKAVAENAPWLQAISKERIRDEFIKIIMSERAADGVELLRKLGLLKYVVPELEEGYGVKQNKHHIYDCYEHNILSLKFAAQKSFNLYVRLAALFHDIAKPRAKRGEGPTSTFYNHEVIGARMTAQILERLKFSKKDNEKIVKLVRYHLFYYNVDEVSESSVRRLVRQAGPENMEELLQVRMADRIGSGVPKAEPYKLRHLRYIIDKAAQDPISVKMLKVDGNDIMKALKIKPGPQIGYILDILLGYVLDDPKKNTKEFLEKEIKKMAELSEKKLASLAAEAKKTREKLATKKDEMTKKKYWVT